jgi:hypothetical protein
MLFVYLYFLFVLEISSRLQGLLLPELVLAELAQIFA